MKAFGKQLPEPTDLPTGARCSSLSQMKKAVSFYMPNKIAAWNALAKVGNPTKSKEVNDVIKSVTRFETQGRGKPSQARRAATKQEIAKTIELCLDKGDIKHQAKYSCMNRFQWALIMRGDDVCHFEMKDLERSTFQGVLKVKVKWSKNVNEERDCPPQYLFGAMDSMFCILIGLAIWLEWFCRYEGMFVRVP